MKNKILLPLFVLLFVANIGFSQNGQEFRKLTQTAFGLGERLEFEINYGFLTAGTAVMEIAPNYQVVNGRNCYDISLSISSASSFEWVYKIQDKYKCYLDADGLFPWKFEQIIREGDYSKDFTAIFDHDSLKVRTTNITKGERKPDAEYVIPKYALDVISAFYYARTMNIGTMSTGSEISMQSFYNDATYDLNIKILQKEDVDVPAGDFRAIVVQPNVKEGALIKKAENIAVWISNDDRKIPLKIQLDVIIGSVKVELSSYKNLAGPLSSKK